ncbi:MAG TPA: TetR/AcrR family transcriptional regulator [Enhygromyxa sp.]|nr:TetR/AcrR family transcriptional regulator [Enhygromyxa sp.]
MARSDARRTEILDAALACYAKLGWAATTIADVRTESGASTGSIYHHFGSKEGVAAALYIELLRRYREPLLERLERTRSARGFVRTLVLHHLDWAAAHPDWARFLNEMRSEAVAVNAAELRESTRRFLELLARRVDAYIEAGEIVKMPKQLYASVIIGPAQDVVRQWLRGRLELDLAEVRTPLANAAWRAVGC